MRTKITVAHRDGVCEIKDGEFMIRRGTKEKVGIGVDPNGNTYLHSVHSFTNAGQYLNPAGAPGLFTTGGERLMWEKIEPEKPIGLVDKISKLIAYAKSLGFAATISGMSGEDMTITFR